MTVFAVLCTATMAVFGFDEPGNVLQDFEFNDAVQAWGAKKAQRGQIESFEGLAEPLYYLQGRGAESLHQTFCVETQTWYVLSFRYRLTDDGKGNAPGGIPFDCAVNVAPGDTCAAFPEKTLNIMNLGGTEMWSRSRMYFQTGDDTTASLNINFYSGNWQIGRIFIRRANDADRLSGGALYDGQFEATLPGDLPHEWRVTGMHDVKRLTFDSDGAHGGQRSLRADFKKSVSLVTRRTLVEFKMTNPQGGVRRFNCREQQWVKPDEWIRFEVMGVPECLPERRGYAGV